MIAIDTPVIVATPDYSGPAVVRGKTTAANGRTALSYGVERPDGERMQVYPPEIVTSPSVVALRRPVAYQPEDLPPCA
ncbi:hypothetical protein [Magnetospirillum fulvum]|uniref:Uncharacterized protein n=1 Tax=Magnetospirillum fulvum MGU-K5 TaxID=1316936 RepID=S9TMM4_MAGFU|nr:hypothetical protein [Magnetospirillum fulvum]EPY03526.1 hypothetical protein K678_00405 [Magnetospirillum fulvum MGU-K5]